MPRPEQREVTFTIDGREVEAPENVDARRRRQVRRRRDPGLLLRAQARRARRRLPHVPGRDRGHPQAPDRRARPRSRTAWSSTRRPTRVQDAQQAVVEFLLINHPLDCPVCDKGGECPLQDISFGWGGGRSRFIEPKRHFGKPLELSPLIAIDRERCILCYRCVRFSQEISEDYQLVLDERGAHSFVGTFDGHPYVAPFSGNIIELCPVGALTSRAYRFRARPWDIEGAGSVCTLCPAQCNVSFTVRDERVLRVLARDNAEVDDGWLCDKGRFAYQAVHVDERITAAAPARRRRAAPGLVGARAREAARRRSTARARARRRAGRRRRHQRGGLPAAAPAARGPGLDRPRLARRRRAAASTLHRALRAPALQATVPDLEFAHAVLVLDCEPVDDAPILDLRLRKGVRRHGVSSPWPQPALALDPNAEPSLRFAPGRRGGAALRARRRAGGVRRRSTAGRRGRRRPPTRSRALADAAARRRRGRGGRVGRASRSGPRARARGRALLNVAARLGLARRAGAGLLSPAAANGRGLREAGVLPNAGPGFADAPPGRDAAEHRRGAGRRRAERAVPAARRPAARPPGPRAVGARARAARTTVDRPRDVPHRGPGRARRPSSSRPRPTPRRRARSPTPTAACSACARRSAAPARSAPVGGSSPSWPRASATTLGSAAARGHARSWPRRVPFYAGLTLEEIGGRGVRWQAREAAAAFGGAELGPFELEAPPRRAVPAGRLRLGTFRSIWASQRGRGVAGAEVPAPAQRAGALTRRRPAPRRPPRATASSWLHERRTASARRSPLRDRRARGHACSSRGVCGDANQRAQTGPAGGGPPAMSYCRSPSSATSSRGGSRSSRRS